RKFIRRGSPGHIFKDIVLEIPVTHVGGVESTDRVIGIFKVIVFRLDLAAHTRVHTRLGDTVVIVVKRVCGTVTQQRHARINILIVVMVEGDKGIGIVAVTGTHQAAAAGFFVVRVRNRYVLRGRFHIQQ